jgi:PAS domain S-box-containing protein
MPNAMIEAPDWLSQTESILEEPNEGVATVDNQLRVVFANEALLQLGHYQREEIQGRTPEAIFPAEDFLNIVRQHEAGQRYRHTRNEFYLPRKGGEKIPAIFSSRVIQGPDGQEYVILILTDISAQKRFEAAPQANPNWTPHKSGLDGTMHVWL